MKVAVIPADVAEPIRFEDVERITSEFLRSVTKGYLEYVVLADGSINMYLNEEGKLENRDFNARATALAHRFEGIQGSDYIVGDVVIVGPPDRDGYDTGIDDNFAEDLRAAFRWERGLRDFQ